MLQTLSIRDFVIVDKLELDFSQGFTVLTGETGAGKSILIDALSLALGARGDSGVIRAGTERAEIIANFDISQLKELQHWLAENELTPEDNQLMVRRIIYRDGRSRAFINGISSTIQQLRIAGEFLVDIYSQHAHHSLLKANYQRQVLDDYAGLSELSTDVASHYQTWHALNERRLEAEKNASAYSDELAELRDQLRELEQLNPNEDEWEPLQQEHNRLSNGASLLMGGEECRELLTEGEFAALRQLSTVQHKLQNLVEYDESLIEAADTLDSAIIQLEETSRYINHYLQRSELDPQRLAEVENRIQEIHATARKHRVRPEALAELMVTWQTRMTELESYSNDGELAKQEAAAKSAYMELAQKLSKARSSAAQELSEKISSEMQRLALAGGSFKVDLSEQAPAATGLEAVTFLSAGHAGVEPKPLSKVASGGELSRISLAIRVTTAQQGDVPTMIFDEVDVGIGGGVAEVVGRLLGQLGAKRQVLVITHLPQVAACGSHHLQVSKTQSADQTLSQIAPLSTEQRVKEIARMLGGIDITETTLNHAKEMLKTGEMVNAA